MSTSVEMSEIFLEYPTESGKVAVLKNASLMVPPGETLAITGPSGSGKTSLLLLLSGLQRPTSGEIFVGDQRLGEMDANTLADWRSEHLGIIFQSFHLLPGLTALGNVSLPLEIAGEERPGNGRLPCWRRLASAIVCSITRGSCLGESSNVSRLPGRWCTSRACCWGMSQRVTWTMKPARKSFPCYSIFTRRANPRWCW